MKRFLWAMIMTACIGLARPVEAQGPCGQGPCGDVCAPICCDNFDGWYIGINGGWVGHDHIWNDRDVWLGSVFLFDLGGGSYHSRNDGGTFGFQGGYNVQCCGALFGIEIDANWANMERVKRIRRAGVLASPEATLRHELSWFGTIRGRAGIVANDLLLFVTAGAAWASTKHRWEFVDLVTTVPIRARYEDHRGRWGIALGAGVEWVLSCWCPDLSLKAEVLNLRFPERTRTVQTFVGLGNARFDLTDTAWVARLGLNYRFCL